MEQRQQLHSETNAKGASECRPPTEALHARVYAAGLQQMTTKTHVGLRHTVLDLKKIIVIAMTILLNIAIILEKSTKQRPTYCREQATTRKI